MNGGGEHILVNNSLLMSFNLMSKTFLTPLNRPKVPLELLASTHHLPIKPSKHQVLKSN